MRQNGQRRIAILLTAVMLLGMLPTSAYADDGLGDQTVIADTPMEVTAVGEVPAVPDPDPEAEADAPDSGESPAAQDEDADDPADDAEDADDASDDASLTDAQAVLDEGTEDELRVTVEQVPDTLELTVEPAEEQTYDAAIRAALDGGYDLLLALDISLGDAELDGEVQVSIQGKAISELPEDALLYHVNQDGQAEEIPYELDRDAAELRFAAQEFSPYVLVTPVTDAADDSADTADDNDTADEPDDADIADDDTDDADDADAEPEEAEGFVLPEPVLVYADPLPSEQITDSTPLRAGLFLNRPLRNVAKVTEGENIGSFNFEVFYGGTWKDVDLDADGETERAYVWTAMSSAKDHHFNFRVSFSLVGEPGDIFETEHETNADGSVVEDSKGQPVPTYQDGDVHIVVPGSILRLNNADGAAQGDAIDFSIPSRQDVLDAIESGETLDSDISFAWYQDDSGNIVIYNFRDIDPGFEGFIEFGYNTSHVTFDYTDMVRSDLATADMTATVTHADGSAAKNTAHGEDGPVVVDTQVELLSTESKIPVKYDSWQSSWGPAPEGVNTSEYTYMVWEIRSRINDNSQKYNFQIEDKMTGLVAKDQSGNIYTVDNPDESLRIPADSYQVMGIRYSGETTFGAAEVGGVVRSQDNQTKSGIRYDYVVTAFKKDFWNSKTHWEITNTTTTTVTPRDTEAILDDDGNIIGWTGDPASTATYTRTFTWNKPTFTGGGGGFSIWEYADGYYRYQEAKDAWPRVYLTGLGMSAGLYSRYDLESLGTEEEKNLAAFTQITNTRLDGLDYAVVAGGYTLGNTKDRTYVKPADGENKEYEHYYIEPVRFVLSNNEFWLFNEDEGIDEKANYRLQPGDYEIDTLTVSVSTTDRDYNENTGDFSTKLSTMFLGDGSEKASNVNTAAITDAGFDKAFAEHEIVRIYGQTSLGGNYDDNIRDIHLADYDVATKKFSYVNSDYVSASTDNRLTLTGSGILGYTMETFNTHYYTCMNSVPSISLLPSENVLGILRTKMGDASTEPVTQPVSIVKAGVNNKIHLNIYDYKAADGSDAPYTHKVRDNRTHSDADYLRVVEKESTLTKNVVATANVPRYRRYQITWMIHQEETISTDATGVDRDPLRQEGGVFYDLLPMGASLDPRSVMVSNEDGAMRENSYTIDSFDNYQGTGRTLLRVTIKDPGDYYDLYYDSIHPYESIRDYGQIVTNPIGYESGNGVIFNGVTNDDENKFRVDTFDSVHGTADSLSDENKPLMRNLPNDGRTGAAFIYTEREYDIAALTSAATGVSKKTLTTTTSAYGDSGVTPNNEGYSYRLRFQNSVANESTDIIMVDVLEAAKSADGGRPSDWTGALQSVEFILPEQTTSDGSPLPACDPVVYVYAAAGNPGDEAVETKRQELYTYFNTDDAAAFDPAAAEGWTAVGKGTEDQIAAVSGTIVAVALDLRAPTSTKEDGSTQNFILRPGNAIGAYLYMQAPQGAERKDKTAGYPTTYNRMQTISRKITSTQVTDLALQQSGVTDVGLIVTGDIDVRKVSETAKEPIYNITFRLFGTSDYGTEIDEKRTSDRNGYLDFMRIEKGEYTLIEFEGVPDWLEDHTPHSVKITDMGRVLIDGEDYTDLTYEVENQPRVHADLRFEKLQAIIPGDSTMPAIPDTTFQLTGTSDYGNEIVLTGTSNALGIVAIYNVEIGTYTLREIKANDNYILNETEYRVVIAGENNETATVTFYEPVLDADGNVQTDASGETVWTEVSLDGLYPVITNQPKYWDFYIRKVDAELHSRRLQGAVFTLTGTGIEVKDEESGAISHTLTVTSDENGKVLFEDLKAGTYTLKEVSAPTGVDSNGHTGTGGTLSYLPDNTEYLVTITDDGQITMRAEGSDADKDKENGEFVIGNPRAKSGQIIVYKQWEDTTPVDQRPDPVIHLSTEESGTINGLTITKEWVGKTPSSADANQVKIAVVEVPSTIAGGYQIVEYIEGDGNAYITTPIVPNTEDFEITTKFRPTASPSDQYPMVYSSRDKTTVGEDSRCYRVFLVKGTNALRGNAFDHAGGTTTNGLIFTVGTDYETRQNYAATYYLGGTAQDWVAIPSKDTKGTITDAPLCLFWQGVAANRFIGRMYYFRVTENGRTVLDMVPVRNADGVYGMYDLVGGKFYPSEGSSQFTCKDDTGAAPTPIIYYSDETIEGSDGPNKVTPDYSNSNAWTYTFENIVIDGKSQFYAYEVEIPEGFVSSAPDADHKVAVISGRATITNTYQGDHWDYGYTGQVQEFKAEESGYYRLEAWGAQGGYGMHESTKSPSQNGAYTAGMIWLDKGQTLYVYVGGQGAHATSGSKGKDSNQAGGWNGGGYGTGDRADGDAPGGGGGATDFRLIQDPNGTTSWDDFVSLKSRIMVAAGAAGMEPWYGGSYGWGGTLTASNLAKERSSSAVAVVEATTQTSGNAFGVGADGRTVNVTTGGSDKKGYNNPPGGVPGGGGGYYGGTYTIYRTSETYNYDRHLATGGTSFISGYPGCNAVSAASTASNIIHTGDSVHYSGLVFTNAVMLAGTDTAIPAHPTTVGSTSTTKGGNGFARITFYGTNASGASDPTPSTTPEVETTASAYDTSDASKWDKTNPDLWSYTIDVFNDNAVYSVWEDLLDGYSSDSYLVNGTAVRSLDGSITKSVVVTNTKVGAYGGLSVTKKLEGMDGSEQKFDFTLTLTDTEGAQLTGSKTFGGLPVVDGQVSFTLADGETFELRGIPTGYHYKITEGEIANGNITSRMSPDGITGTIIAYGEENAIDDNNKVIWENLFEAPPTVTQTLALSKVVTGSKEEADKDTLYRIYGVFTDLEKNQEYQALLQEANGGYTVLSRFTTDDEGAATASFELKDGQTVQLGILTVAEDGSSAVIGVPTGATFQFMEEAGDYTASYRIQGSGLNCLRTSSENIKAQESLATAVETVDEGEDQTVTFTNELAGVQTLRVVKRVLDAGGNKVDSESDDPANKLDFPVNIHFYGLKPGTVINSSVGNWIADDMGETQKDVLLRNGGEVNIINIPVGAQYVVTESKNRYIGTYEISVPEGDTADFVSETGGNDTAYTAMKTEQETVNRYENATVTIINRPAFAPLTVSKTVTGNMGSKTKGFSFTLTCAEMAGQTVTVGGEEKTFTDKGVLTFTLRHGDSVAIENLPVGAEYSIVETQALGYTTTYTVTENGKTGHVLRSRTADGTVPAEAFQVDYTNDLSISVPTGIDMHWAFPVLLFLLGLGGASALLLPRRRRREGKHER